MIGLSSRVRRYMVRQVRLLDLARSMMASKELVEIIPWGAWSRPPLLNGLSGEEVDVLSHSLGVERIPVRASYEESRKPPYNDWDSRPSTINDYAELSGLPLKDVKTIYLRAMERVQQNLEGNSAQSS
jgi:hypothetical protein